MKEKPAILPILKQKESARKVYYRLESSKHNQLNLISNGLMISKTKPFLGASRDNIVSAGTAKEGGPGGLGPPNNFPVID